MSSPARPFIFTWQSASPTYPAQHRQGCVITALEYAIVPIATRIVDRRRARRVVEEIPAGAKWYKGSGRKRIEHATVAPKVVMATRTYRMSKPWASATRPTRATAAASSSRLEDFIRRDTCRQREIKAPSRDQVEAMCVWVCVEVEAIREEECERGRGAWVSTCGVRDFG